MGRLNNKSSLKEERRALRNNLTKAEFLLWQNLKGKKLEGRKFRRQHSFANYIMDFYCPAERLAIELDGQHHYTEEGKREDAVRDAFLREHGIRVLRFENKEVMNDIQAVLQKIKKQFNLPQSPSLAKEGETGGGRKGYKNTKLGWIPEDWKLLSIENIALIDHESLNGKTDPDYTFDYISLSDVDSEDFHIETTKLQFKNAPSRARRIVQCGDVLMSTVRPNLQGFTVIRNDVSNLICSTGFAVLSVKENFNNEYLYHFLFSSGISRQLHGLLVGSNYPAINSSDVRRLKIALPEINEQKAIAQVLSTWDKAIDTLTQLIAQKQLKKKALMQQLLTGKKRFPAFAKASAGKPGFEGEWKEVKISDVANEYSIKNRNNKDLTVLSCTKYDGLVPSLEYFGRKIYSDNLDAYKVVKRGTFAYATNHINEGSIGFQDIVEEGLISPMYTCFKTNEFVDKSYFFMLLKSHEFMHHYVRRTEGSINRRGGLRWGGFSGIKFQLPPIEEQLKISSIIELVNKEIGLLNKNLDALKNQKKGLMQVLLTGKKRVNIIKQGENENS